MKMRLAGVAVLVAAVLGLTAAVPATEGDAKGVTATGTASVQGVPDVAEWSFGVHATGTTAQAALGEAGATMRRIVAALRGAGIARAGIQTEQASLYPETKAGRVVAYAASASVRATVENVARSGRVVDAAVRAGANEVWGPALDVSSRDSLYERALEQAYDQARAKAETLATKAGLTLGAPISIREGETGGVVPYADSAFAMKADVEIEPGTNEITATVTVTFDAS